MPPPATPLVNTYTSETASPGAPARAGAFSTRHPCLCETISAYSAPLASVTTYSSPVPLWRPACSGRYAGTAPLASSMRGGPASTVTARTATSVGAPRTHPSRVAVAANLPAVEYRATAAPVNSDEPDPAGAPCSDRA